MDSSKFQRPIPYFFHFIFPFFLLSFFSLFLFFSDLFLHYLLLYVHCILTSWELRGHSPSLAIRPIFPGKAVSFLLRTPDDCGVFSRKGDPSSNNSLRSYRLSTRFLLEELLLRNIRRKQEGVHESVEKKSFLRSQRKEKNRVLWKNLSIFNSHRCSRGEWTFRFHYFLSEGVIQPPRSVKSK